ncbi:PRC-barrel domain-containing protein [Pararhizobium sp.]|uniref:PRC-barrel domain-containing protein n=1 Tax=Pararhizobium sp. TaxID=1977563 RepID=UPI00271FDAC6|nr:PRC-barrel domain-containing protein [Pararhizobium sp.]MDO9414914.1 PRC-barrel domain-containing protein [Pararhizobium sp.]
MTYQDSTFGQGSVSRQDANIRETHDLIGSDKVEGTRVYGADGKHIGSIERVILEKRSGRVSYAVLAFGGFLGFGHDHYPVPWQTLSYDENLGGYRTDLTKEKVEAAPHYRSDEEYQWNQENGRRVYDYYGIPPYWM